MAISGGPCVLHPGTVHSPTAQLASSGSVRLVAPGASTLSLTSSVNMKIHRVPPQSNLHGHRLSTLSKTIGLLTLQHCSHENVQTQWPRSLCLSAMNLYRRQRRMFYGRLGSHSYSKPIPTSALWTHSHPSLSRVRKLAFRATLLVELNVLITHLCSYILRSSASQFKLSFGKDGSRNLGSPVQLLLLPNRPRP